MTRRWVFRTAGAPDREGCLFDRVLSARGLGEARGTGEREGAGSFLHPSLRDLHDPSLIPDLDRAAQRLLGAARARERIVIYGDYDVDGITASTILYHMLLAIEPGADVATYIPHRLEEGYGLNVQAIERLAREGARVVVSVDCGITAVEPACQARCLGLDLIITDHHTPPASMDDLPDAMAVVHPRRPDSTYPFGDLCGAGVAYKLAWRLATLDAGSAKVHDRLRTLLLELLAHAALGAIADVVPLVDENRVFARFGLARIRGSSLPGLGALVDASGLGSERVDSEHVGFALAPRLNACGRLGHAGDALELFTTAGPARAREIARRLCRLNDQRREMQRTIADQATQLAQEAGMTGTDRRTIVLADASWHPGVVGIVCSRLADRFARPTILLHREAEVCTGSGRSIDGFDLHGALAACSGHLIQFGGHRMAAGLKIRTRNLDAFVEAFIAEANRRLTVDDLVLRLHVDCRASLGELTPEVVTRLDTLAPFGRGNPRVAVRLADVRVVSDPERFGRQGSHLSVRVGAGDRQVRLVGWNWARWGERIRAGSRIEAVVTPKISTWNGSARVEPEIRDVRLIDRRA